MNYNVTRPHLLIPEYGRTIQQLATHLLTIADDDLRLKNAEALVAVMSNIAPQQRAMENFENRIWDHLYLLTDYKLEVNGPFPKPNPEALAAKPQPLPYPQGRRKLKHLGKNFESLLQKGLAETDPEKRKGLTQAIGYYMKLAYANWHKEPTPDEMVKTELAKISNNELQYESSNFKVLVDTRTSSGNSFTKKKFNKKKFSNKPNNNNTNNKPFPRKTV